jgi:hypothetical protein
MYRKKVGPPGWGQGSWPARQIENFSEGTLLPKMLETRKEGRKEGRRKYAGKMKEGTR